MRTTTVTTTTSLLSLGKQGENLVHQIRFPFVETWAELYGAGSFAIIHRRNGDVNSYQVTNTETIDENFCWNVTNTDVANMGQGQAELVYYVGSNVVAKSITYKTETLKSDFGTTVAPDPWTSMQQEVSRNATAAQTSATNAAASATAASTSATSASTSATNAASSALASQTSATNAATSESNASGYATNASGSATEAQTQANAAATSATNAAGSASQAASSAASILELFPIKWTDVTEKPDEFTPSAHTHSELTTHVNNTGIHTTALEKETWNNKYQKPSSGIPYSDLSSEVKETLDTVETLIEKNISLIETISLSSVTTLIQRDAEPSGTSYDFNLVYLVFTVPATSGAANVSVYVNSSDISNLCSTFSAGIHTTTKYYSALIINKNGIRVPISSVATSSLQVSAYPTMMIGLAQTSSTSNINKIIIQSGGRAFPAGTTVQIYAVRN